jgi:hypothetical protein
MKWSLTLKRYSARCDPSFRRRNLLLKPVIGCARLSPLSGPNPFLQRERDVLNFLEAPLNRLKHEAPEVRLDFVFEAFNEIVISSSQAEKVVAAALLRSGMALNAVEAVRLVELVSQPELPFPLKAILSAVDSAPRTPALLTALHQLRGSVTP